MVTFSQITHYATVIFLYNAYLNLNIDGLKSNLRHFITKKNFSSYMKNGQFCLLLLNIVSI